MINALLSKITNLLEKNFLFAAFLPALLFLLAVAVTLTAVVGIETSLYLIGQLTTAQQALFMFFAGLITVIFAYILSALHTTFLEFWSGRSPFPLGLLTIFWIMGKERETKRYTELLNETRHSSPWRTHLQDFVKAARLRWSSQPIATQARSNATLVTSFAEWKKNLDSISDLQTPTIKELTNKIKSGIDDWSPYAAFRIYNTLAPLLDQLQKNINANSNHAGQFDKFIGNIRNDLEARSKARSELSQTEVAQLLEAIQAFRDSPDEQTAKTRLQWILEWFEVYSAKQITDATSCYEIVKSQLIVWDNEENQRINTAFYNLDRTFGSLETLRPTRLGNVVDAYEQYASKRYKIEAGVFWPRLRSVIKPEFLSVVQESQILLDFSLTMASLSAVYTVLALVAGPWIWFNPWFWLSLSLLSAAISYFFYCLGLTTACQLGELTRAAFDLFRLDLMAALNRGHPATFKDERQQWVELSKVAVYGTEIDFPIKPPSTSVT